MFEPTYIYLYIYIYISNYLWGARPGSVPSTLIQTDQSSAIGSSPSVQKKRNK